MPELLDGRVDDERGRRYRCRRRAGSGAQGEVYECEGSDGQRYALKIYTPGNAMGAAGERIQRLIALDLSRRHPALAAPMARLRSGPRLGHFAPWAPGASLCEWYARPSWDLSEALLIAATVARAMGELEEIGIAHGDVQPGNVLLQQVERHFEVHIVDFDNMLMPGAPPPAFVPPHLYQAPEIVSGGSGDLASDRWSLAVLVHELTLLKRPFVAFESDADAYRKAVCSRRWREDPLSPPQGSELGLPAAAVGPTIATLFRRALCGRRENRPSAAEWAARLREAAHRVWACDDCGQQFVMASDSRCCPSGGHAAAPDLAFRVGHRLIALDDGVTPLTRDGLGLGGDRSVSQLHAVVYRDGCEYRIEDRAALGIRKWVSGRGWVPVRQNVLRSGDRLRLGDVGVEVVAR